MNQDDSIRINLADPEVGPRYTVRGGGRRKRLAGNVWRSGFVAGFGAALFGWLLLRIWFD